MIRWLAALCLITNCNAASARDFALLKIRLDRVMDGGWAPISDCEPKPGYECIQFYQWDKYRVTLLRTYAGHVPHRVFSAMLWEHGPHAEGTEMYVIAERAEGEIRFRNEGRDLFPGEDYVVVRFRGSVHNGFCMALDDEDLKKVGLADAMKELRRDHPCKDN